MKSHLLALIIFGVPTFMVWSIAKQVRKNHKKEPFAFIGPLRRGVIKVVQIPKNKKYTTLPSADVLLDPKMVQDILRERETELLKEVGK